MGWHLLQSYLGPVTILPDLQSNGVTVPLYKYLLFVVTSNYLVTFTVKYQQLVTVTEQLQ
jgi:hypothetical protein